MLSERSEDKHAWMDAPMAIGLLICFLFYLALKPIPKGEATAQAIAGTAAGLIVAAYAVARLLNEMATKKPNLWPLYLVMTYAGGFLALAWGLPAFFL